jgi:hypothetical protein
MDEDPAKEVSINVDLLDRAVKAVEALCPNFQYIVLPTGTKVNPTLVLKEIYACLTFLDLWSPSSRQVPVHTTSNRVTASNTRALCIANVLL